MKILDKEYLEGKTSGLAYVYPAYPVRDAWVEKHGTNLRTAPCHKTEDARKFQNDYSGKLSCMITGKCQLTGKTQTEVMINTLEDNGDVGVPVHPARTFNGLTLL